MSQTRTHDRYTINAYVTRYDSLHEHIIGAECEAPDLEGVAALDDCQPLPRRLTDTFLPRFVAYRHGQRRSKRIRPKMKTLPMRSTNKRFPLGVVNSHTLFGSSQNILY